MHAKDWALSAVLQERQQWVIPVYQRTYAWETGPDKQLPKLWDDLRERAREVLGGSKPKPHFVGAIIYAEPAEHLFGTVNKRYLVDGQQRITTFSLVLCALREIARAHGVNRLVHTANEYLFNAKSASMADPGRETFKLWPSSYDRPLFADIVSLTAEEVSGRHADRFYKNGGLVWGRAPKLLAAFWYLKEHIADFVSEEMSEGVGAEPVLDALIAGFLNGFQIVVVQLGKQDDAQAIFASLNGSAQPLTAFDLIRNDIFHRAGRALEDNDVLYDSYWRDLETEFWKTEVKQGRMKRPRADHLIAHTLVAETGRDIIVGQVANEYRRFAEAQAFPSVTDEVRSLMTYSRAYEEMELRAKGGALSALAAFLSTWDTAAMHPLVLWIEVRDVPLVRKAEAYSLIEAYLVRRDLCEMGNKNYNKVAADALRAIHAAQDPIDALFAHMAALTGEASRLPSDAEVLRAASSRQVYLSMGSQKLRYVLSRLECALRDRFDEDVTVATENLTVEHVMPNRWAAHWPLPSGISVPDENPYDLPPVSEEVWAEVEEREALKHTLGNLTLLTSSLNPSLGNSGWPEKRVAISESLLVLNRNIARHDRWDGPAIRDRAASLAGIVNAIWPHPTIVAPQSSISA